MGRKGIAQQNDLVELIIEKSNGGKNTIVYVTQEVNDYLAQNNLKIRLSRESIRRVLKTHSEEVEDAKRSIEAAKAMAEILKDNPGTEATEAVVMTMASLIGKEVRQIEGLEFENPNDLVSAMTRIAEVQLKMSSARTKAVQALDKAKEKIKNELTSAISNDSDLLQRLCLIVDNVTI